MEEKVSSISFINNLKKKKTFIAPKFEESIS